MDDKINVQEWINWKISRIITQDLQSICKTPRNDFDFNDENWFENRPLVINTLAKITKRISKALVAVSTLHKLEYITVICKWPYLVQLAESCLMQQNVLGQKPPE